MCRIDDGDPVTTLTRAVKRKARKAHKCDECRRIIAPGERYEYTTFMWEGDFTEHKICDRCQVGADWLIKNCGGFIYQEIDEEIEEHAQEYGKPLAIPLRRLVVGMRRKWEAFGGGLMPLPKMPPSIEV